MNRANNHLISNLPGQALLEKSVAVQRKAFRIFFLQSWVVTGNSTGE